MLRCPVIVVRQQVQISKDCSSHTQELGTIQEDITVNQEIVYSMTMLEKTAGFSLKSVEEKAFR